MRPRFDGYYTSGFQWREEWHAGVRMVDEWYGYLKLFESGEWIEARHPTSRFDFEKYAARLTERDFEEGWTGRHPYDAEYNFRHQSGRYRLRAEGIEFVFRHKIIELESCKWVLRIDTPERLISAAGSVYTFRPVTPA